MTNEQTSAQVLLRHTMSGREPEIQTNIEYEKNKGKEKRYQILKGIL
jgi:hypothetical protein